jgi:haloalkane dehalogenase
VTDAVRTPDQLLENLPGFPWEPRYTEIDGLRIARIDEPGEKDNLSPVVFFHGEPTWSYLWRKVIPPVLEAGHRCIAPDYPGFGRSDKPTDMGWYSYDRHFDFMQRLLFEELDVRGATAVVHDWGGPIGLRLAAEHPDRFERLVVMDTGLFTGHQPMTDAWKAFRDFVERTEDLPIAFLVKGATAQEMPDDVFAAYDAPYPSADSKAGARAFPLMLPTSPDAPGAEAGQRTLETLAGSPRPSLVLWAKEDPIIPPAVGAKFAERLGLPEPEVVEGASHFLQEDQGEKLGARIAEWLGEQGA